MLVKICGITTEEAARHACKSGADFIGFVFAASKRKISPENAARIAATLPPKVKKVGVFVNETRENILNIAGKVDLDVIQLHGDEPAELAARLPYPVIKAFSIQKEETGFIPSYPCDYYLLDSPASAYRGGNGVTFNWNLVKETKIQPDKVMIAGGLSKENVQEAIAITNAAGVDVSSGVETNGEKDLEKMEQFITKAKRKDD